MKGFYIVFILSISTLCTPGTSLSTDDGSTHDISEAESQQSSHMINTTMVTVPTHLLDHTTDEPGTVTMEPAVVTSSCTAFINSFADAAADYTKCSITHARPFRFCEHCIGPYLAAKDIYELLIKGSAKDEQGARCSDVILNSDKIQLVTKTKDFIEQIWDDCNCKNCFNDYETHNGSSSGKLNNETLKFFEHINETWTCFQNYSQGEIIPFGNFTFNKTVCTKCKDSYTVLNHYYEELEEKYSHNSCMDMVDAMNHTRLVWSKDFSCSQKNGDLLPVLLLSSAFATLPIIFYVLNKVFGSRRETKLMKQKRLRDASNSVEPNGHDMNSLTT